MRPFQKRIVVLLAIVDLLVIGGLAAVVVRNSRPAQPVASVAVPTPSACTTLLLEALAPCGDSTASGWDTATPGEPLTATTTSPAHIRVTLSPAIAEVEGSAQVLWTVLDHLPRSLPDLCVLPPSVTLMVTTRQTGEAVHYTAEFEGTALSAWLRGELDDEALAAGARYREITTAGP